MEGSGPGASEVDQPKASENETSFLLNLRPLLVSSMHMAQGDKLLKKYMGIKFGSEQVSNYMALKL